MISPTIRSLIMRDVTPVTDYRGASLFSGVLDILSVSSVAAYALRKLRVAFAGAAIRVRRSSDNAEQDIGFTAAGNLDTATLLTFTGAGSGFVTTWYDQSGNARDLLQATAASQPRIVNAGVYDAATGIFFDGVDDTLVTATAFPQIQSQTLLVSMLAGLYADTPSNFAYLGANLSSSIAGGGNGWYIAQRALIDWRATASNGIITNGPTLVKTGFGDLTLRSITSTEMRRESGMRWYVRSNNGTVFANPTLLADENITIDATLSIAAINQGTSGKQKQNASEIIIFFSYSEADLVTLARNQGSYYGIPVA